ncbi:hypothetical protein AMS68_006341 [Peltaster fructicola]|uniref:Uncharacterized protein n=1 Tax=Peltaster fructicola TaxID=286661 RepID=A0A6H0Y1E4_9PEZI|nr:hypothetical protein AMS68_006341 [Peltaster fructicola]
MAAASSSSTIAFTSYVAQVDGFNNAAVCASKAYANVFWEASLNGSPANCQPKTTAPAYGSCLCSKDYDLLLASATSSCVTWYSCTGTETSQVQSLFSAFCSSATVAARAIAAGAPANTAATTTTTGSTIPTASTTSSTSAPSTTSSTSPGLSTPAIVGVSIGAFVAAVILVTLIINSVMKKREDWPRPSVARKQEHISQEMVPGSHWVTAPNHQHMQQPEQVYVGQAPNGLSPPTSPYQRPQRDAMEDWIQNQPPLYQIGTGPQSQQSGTMAPSQIFSDGSRR